VNATACRDASGAIARAKREWECTVDALPDLVCLVDRAGHVVRANLTVERWGLGPVAAALGRDLHVVLHPSCRAEACELARATRRVWGNLESRDGIEFELADAQLAMTLRIVVRPVDRGERRGVGISEGIHAAVVVSDVTAFQRTRDSWTEMHSELESRVRERTDELMEANRALQNEVSRRSAAEEALVHSRDELALLSEQLMTAQEVERRRISGDLHDSVGQALSAVKYGLERGAELARRGECDDPLSVFEHAVAGVQHTMEEVRSIAVNLRPPLLDDLGAVSAAAWFCRRFAQDYPLLRVETTFEVRDGEIPSRLGIALFRSLQEMLANVAKHASATTVHVTIRRTPRRLTLIVQDDGVGLRRGDRKSSGNGRGLRNLRERAGMTGGHLTLAEARPGTGTVARIDWTLTAAEAPLEGAA
jgi:signal transduction histidine kinase